MRRYYRQQHVKFKFEKIVTTTAKAALFQIKPDVLIWVPKSWIIKLNAKSFAVKSHISSIIKTSIIAEKKALKQ